MPDDSPSVKVLVSVGPSVKGFHDWHKEIGKAPKFVPNCVNTNSDTMLMYFTSGTSGEPKMVAHDFLYALGHLTTGVFCTICIKTQRSHRRRHRLRQNRLGQTLLTMVCAGAVVFVFDHEKFTADKILYQ